jgi:hypothetical protein
MHPLPWSTTGILEPPPQYAMFFVAAQAYFDWATGRFGLKTGYLGAVGLLARWYSGITLERLA